MLLLIPIVKSGKPEPILTKANAPFASFNLTGFSNKVPADPLGITYPSLFTS